MADMENMVEAIADIGSAGLDIRSMNFSLTFDLSDASENVSAGMARGQGPRYGMAPLVCQSTQEAVDAFSTYGLLGSASSDDTRACHDVYRVYGIVSAPLIDQTVIGTEFTTIPVKKTYYWLAVGINDVSISQPNFFSFVPLGTSVNAATFDWTIKAALAYGLLRPVGLNTSGALPSVFKPFCYRVNYPAATGTALTARTLWQLTQSSGTLDYASIAVFSVPGVDVPAMYLAGEIISQASGSISGTLALNTFGAPNFTVDRKFKNVSRRYSIYNLNTSNGLQKEYIFDATPTATDLLAQSDQAAAANLQGTWVTGSVAQIARLDAAAAAASTFGLWVDSQNVMNTEHTLLLAAIGKPVAVIVQSWARSTIKSLEQAVDLRNRRFKPPIILTGATQFGVDRYSEASVGDPTGFTPVATCWDCWPNFVEGTAGATDAASARTGAIHVTSTAANTGVLRANTTYEFTYSIFDKQLGNESNVGMPALFRTGTADFCALTLYRDAISAGNYLQNPALMHSTLTPLSYLRFMPNSSTNGTTDTAMNYVEIRVYYREFGSFEWLPALYIDAAQYFCDPNLKELYACTGDSVGTTGGQPGGFNDYSELPDDAYSCVLIWKQRIFWLSDKSLIFSLQNNGFAYPVRNAIPIQQGQYKGAIVHNYPGQADQDSRLVVFGTSAIYVGKFTGIRSQMAVQVSPDSVGTFDVDGSDFVLNSWTSVTAFSYRSACVANGILYYWGPQGVYRDDGRDTPTKISDDLEPDIFTLYAKQRTDDIHCTYSEQTKEIIWFYFDNAVYSTYAATSPQTKLLVFNTITEVFSFGSTSACVDASQKIGSGSGQLDLVRSTGGDRTLIFSRVSKASTGVQQAYFFDYRNRSGDLRYGLERLVNQIATPVAGTRRLYLPNGSTGLTVGDYIASDQISGYTNDQNSSGSAITVEDFVAKITAINTSGTHYIDVTMPTNIISSFVTAATLGPLCSFPVYDSKTILAADAAAGNAFPYILESQYWCPKGLNFNAFWKYVHFLFKLTLLKAEGLGLEPGTTFGHRSAQSLAYQSEDLVFGTITPFGVWTDELNSDGHQQIYHPLDIGVNNFEGQGLKLMLSGFHYAHKWVLQYLAMYGNPQTYDFLKQFEG